MSNGTKFDLVSPFGPTGDQPEAIRMLLEGFSQGRSPLTLEGVTGSGKTFTMANVIARMKMPTLIISHNKTLAAQLFSELKNFFPNNAVEYFVSYYDYYQPEAYIPQTDTYIEKDASINEQIERYRLSATNSLLGRSDVIIVASVSCIYGLGSPDDYRGMLVDLRVGEEFERDDILRKLVDIQYTRNDISTEPGTFRVRGDVLDIFPSYDKRGIRVEFFGSEVDRIQEIDPLTGAVRHSLNRAVVSPAKHFVMPKEKIDPALARIRAELVEQVHELESRGLLLEAQRLQQRTAFDLEMLKEIGFCSGIENYSRHLSGRKAGETPATLLDYFEGEFLTIIDESHVTLPQIRGMYNGDQARKKTLVGHGFRLPSALDNRPLNFTEFHRHIGPLLFTTATPGRYENEHAEGVVTQVIRPTGLLDPPVEVRPLSTQIDDLMAEVRAVTGRGDRTLVTTLTKRTAEDLSEYLAESGMRVEYLHSDITALKRVEILRRLRKGEFDCLVGINLLREGLDLPEVALVAVLDADKEGFLRSDTALMQTAGRTARHVDGRVILYADRITDSMRRMMDTTKMRREAQIAYNEEHCITPRSVVRGIAEGMAVEEEARNLEKDVVSSGGEDFDIHVAIQQIEKEMLSAADALEFERAAVLRDELQELREQTGALDE